MAQSGAIRALIERLRRVLFPARRASPLSANTRYADVGSLYDLVDRHPDLRHVIRHYSSQHFVPVTMNTCSLPQRPDGSIRHDCVVFGLFYVDRREAANPQSTKVIRQDYFVVWTDGSGRMRYYSGGPRAWKRHGPIYWRDIVLLHDRRLRGPGQLLRLRAAAPACRTGAASALVPGERFRASLHPRVALAFGLALAVARMPP